jgi:hypothetical protein
MEANPSSPPPFFNCPKDENNRIIGFRYEYNGRKMWARGHSPELSGRRI